MPMVYEGIDSKRNTGIEEKIAVRKKGLSWLRETPKIMEMFAGRGEIYRVLYRHFNKGLAFEEKRDKAASLARQRPTWRVFECDCVRGLNHNIHLGQKFNFVDVDPYGNPWKAIDALFNNDALQDRAIVCVNDGLKMKLRIQGGRNMDSVRPMWRKFGDLKDKRYLTACKWFINKKADHASYDMIRFKGFDGGYNNQMTHYLFMLKRPSLKR